MTEDGQEKGFILQSASGKDEWKLVGRSKQMRQIINTIEQVAPTDISVLIEGESGTGKEMVARAIHENSRRSDKPLISVNCGAIPEGILESELFGHEKGSFTGATGSRKGYFEAADHGTMFLDEIGEMSMHTQVKLLRVLENQEFLRVGGNASVKVDVRIIAATNKELEEAVRANEFRKDLYFRLNAVKITIPPLRTRPEDIGQLTRYFLKMFSEKLDIEIVEISQDAFDALKQYSWPGNIRELYNLLESLVVLKKGSRITMDDLPEVIRSSVRDAGVLPVPLHKSSDQAEREILYRTLLMLGTEISEIKKILTERLPDIQGYIPAVKYNKIDPRIIEDTVDVTEEDDKRQFSIKEHERELIKRALDKYQTRREAAQELGISERTLYRKLNEMNLL